MKTVKTFGLITKCSIYQEYDKMVTIISPNRGKIDFIARGCRRPKSKLVSASQPFVYGEFIFSEKQNRFSLNQVDAKESFYDLRLNLQALTIATRSVEVVTAAAHFGEPCEELFELLYHTLSFLCYGKANPVDIFVCFLAKFFKNQGVETATTRCAICSESTFQNAVFSEKFGALCERCKNKTSAKYEKISPLALEALRRMIALELNKMDKIVLPEIEVREKLLCVLKNYYFYNFEKQIKDF